jgi:uncharacterized protein (TIGR02246 family)
VATLLEEKDAIRELLAEYCFAFDGGDFERWVGLFTDDGIFDVGGRIRLVGRERLREYVKKIALTDGKPMLKHCVMNEIIRVVGDAARVESYLLVAQGAEKRLAITIAGRYEDRLVRTPDGWRFAERKAILDLSQRFGT